jgi:hypothetical protein
MPCAKRARTARPMEKDRDPKKVDSATGTPPDEGLVYDKEMTDVDEANVPPDSDADPATPGGEGESA